MPLPVPPPPGLVGGGVVEASHHPGPVHQQAYSVNTAREQLLKLPSLDSVNYVHIGRSNSSMPKVGGLREAQEEVQEQGGEEGGEEGAEEE